MAADKVLRLINLFECMDELLCSLAAVLWFAFPAGETFIPPVETLVRFPPAN
jgi:hypothetical protein